jgi:SAM-dependent methyltransferase
VPFDYAIQSFKLINFFWDIIMASSVIYAAAAASQPVISNLKICFSCNKTSEKLSQCAKCHFAKYCSRECQSKDWPEHKIVCKAAVTKDEVSGTSIPLIDQIWANILKEKRGIKRLSCGIVGEKRATPLIVKYFTAQQNSNLAIDIGCGGGASAIFLLKRGWKVIALDSNKEYVDYVKEMANKANQMWLETGQLTVLHVDIEKELPFERASLVLINDVIPYLYVAKVKTLWDKIYSFLEVEGYIVGSLFVRGEAPILNLQMLGAWFVEDQKFVESLLTESNYQIKECRHRPKDVKSAVVEFIAQKKSK